MCDYVFIACVCQEAERAKAALDGKIALGKKITVDWAHYDPANKRNVSVSTVQFRKFFFPLGEGEGGFRYLVFANHCN